MPEAEKQGDLDAKAEADEEARHPEASDEEDGEDRWKSYHVKRKQQARNIPQREFETDENVRYTDQSGNTHYLAVDGARLSSNHTWEYRLRDRTVQQNLFGDGSYIAERLLASDS